MHAGQMKLQTMNLVQSSPAKDLFTFSTDHHAMAGTISVHIHDTMAPLEAAWRALEAQDINSLHQGYDWCHAWHQCYGRPLVIVEGRQNGKTAFILPLEVVRGRLFTTAQFMGAVHANLNTGLMSEAFLDSATPELMTEIVADIREKVGQVDCVLLTNMPGTWRGRQLPFAMLPHVENQNHAFALTIKDDFVQTLAQLNAKRRRKKYSVGHRRLEALGGYEHVIAETPADRNAFLDLFFKQKGARLIELDLPNVFSCPKTRKFLHMLAQQEQTERAFPLRMHALRMTGGEFAGEVPAVAGLSRKGDHLIVQFCSIGSGPTVDASPGELLFHLMVEQYNREEVAPVRFRHWRHAVQARLDHGRDHPGQRLHPRHFARPACRAQGRSLDPAQGHDQAEPGRLFLPAEDPLQGA